MGGIQFIPYNEKKTKEFIETKQKDKKEESKKTCKKPEKKETGKT